MNVNDGLCVLMSSSGTIHPTARAFNKHNGTVQYLIQEQHLSECSNFSRPVHIVCQ